MIFYFIFNSQSLDRFFRPLIFAFSLILTGQPLAAEIFLPGTQPEENGVKFEKITNCRVCHTDRSNELENDPWQGWQGSLMSQSARDPVFRAAMAVANQDIPTVGEYCIRCHSPTGWLQGRGFAPDGSDLNQEDIDHGVSCDFCHRLVDPSSAEAPKFAENVPPGYGNAMFVIGQEKMARGPYDDSQKAKYHDSMKSEFHSKGQLCGTCHNVSHPLMAEDIRAQAPAEYGHIERTFSEWVLNEDPDKKSCQQCHMEQVEGGGKAAKLKNSPHRDYFASHGTVGGSTWVQDAIIAIWGDDKLVDEKALLVLKEKTRRFLRTAATMEITKSDDGNFILRATNKTGHKLPTGYPEGRRMWINVKYLDGSGNILAEAGAYGNKETTLFEQAYTAPTLLNPETTRIYECLPAISEEKSQQTGIPAGPSFHFVLNDVVVKDNRIPPRGYRNESYKKHHAEAVGADYADGQNWDDFILNPPEETAKIIASLQYQSVTWEYIKFLAEENKTDEWGKKLLKAWEDTGKCPPESIATTEIDL